MGLFRFHGLDAKKFLQGLVTADLGKLAPGVCLPACELYEETPETILAVTRPNAAIGFLTAFDKKVMLSDSSLKALRSQQAWLVIGEPFMLGLPWPRLSEPALLSDAEFDALRVASGFPWFGTDMTAESLPLEARQDAAISLEKGCYMGQETVSRIVFRGHVNKILMGLRGKVSPGDPIMRDGKEIGRVTSAAGDVALGIVRYEDAKPGATDSGELFLFESWPKPLSQPNA